MRIGERTVGLAAVVIETTELRCRERELREADRRKDEFLAMLAHELRNPLGAIGNAIEVLHRARSADAQLHTVREVLDRQVRHLARLAQVVRVHNAIKYTPNGGTIRVQATAAGGMAIVSVHDNGPGIDPALLPHVFELFTQGNRGIDRAEGGLGIGLTLVQRLVALHGGRVEALNPAAGRGAEFRAHLPLAVPVATPTTPTRAARDTGRSRRSSRSPATASPRIGAAPARPASIVTS